MKISTQEFINLIQERPALWQKSHPDFANREIRMKLLTQIAVKAETDATECSKKLKNLKDSMRSQVAKLPRTSSGLPAFDSSDHVTWPFFKGMMFMKDEFTGRKMTPSIPYKEIGASETLNVKIEDSYSQLYENDGFSVDQNQSAPSIPSAPKTTRSSFQVETSANASNQSWDSSEDNQSQSAKKLKLKRRRATSSQSESEYEKRKLTLLEKLATTDELDVFASDIANDLRKIKCPLKLLQAKSKIRRIAEDFAMSELVPSSAPLAQQVSAAMSPSHEHQNRSQYHY